LKSDAIQTQRGTKGSGQDPSDDLRAEPNILNPDKIAIYDQSNPHNLNMSVDNIYRAKKKDGPVMFP